MSHPSSSSAEATGASTPPWLVAFESLATEDASGKQHELHRALFDLGADALLLIDSATCGIIDANRRAAAMYGSSQDELRQLRVTELSAEPELTRRALADHVDTVPLRWHRKRDGLLFPVESTVNHFAMLGREVCLAAIRDITDRHAAEEEARRNAERSQCLLQILERRATNVQDLLEHALNQALALTSSRFGYIYHYDEDRQEFILNCWSKEVMDACRVTNPQTRYKLANTGIWGEAVRQRRPIIVNDFQAAHALKRGYPAGHAHLDNFLTVPIAIDAKIVAVVGVANKPADYLDADVLQLRLLMEAVWKIVERLRAEEAAQCSEARFQQLIQRAPLPLALLNRAGEVLHVNDRFTSTYGYMLTDVPTLDRWWQAAFPDPEHRRRAMARWELAVREASQTGTDIAAEDYRITCHEGETRVAAVSGITMDDLVLVVLMDRTPQLRAEAEKLAMETQLRLAQRLESVGRLAGGVAHEINTPAQFVADNFEFLHKSVLSLLHLCDDLRKPCDPGAGAGEFAANLARLVAGIDFDFLLDEIPHALEESRDGLQRITRIVGSLKEFSNPCGAEKRPVDLRRALETAITVSRHEWKYVAEVTTDFAEDLPPVPCILDEVNQAVLGLIVNAAHAIEDALRGRAGERGRITVRTRHEPGWAVIEVEDTGIGMPPEARHQVFEPYSASRIMGQRPGHGLAIVHTVVVKKHGGRVEIATEPGLGTTLRIALPLATEAVRKA